MNKIQTYALFYNLIIYLIMIFPIFIILLKKDFTNSFKKLVSCFIYITILEIFFSLFLYIFAREIFSIFTKTTGIINYAVYASRILFISSSLYGIKFLVPVFLFNISSNKKTTILVLSKIVVHIIFIFTFYKLFSFKGILYSFPICDLIYYIIYLILFFKNIPKKNI